MGIIEMYKEMSFQEPREINLFVLLSVATNACKKFYSGDVFERRLFLRMKTLKNGIFKKSFSKMIFWEKPEYL
ncbi:hypothetical protein DD829_09335 [Chryseobacterium sp. HMWF035]|nr:hypothetical protein DBR25_18020 [Chryseobacterium sp. HMWF001]PVV57016.1 hypothetical protein DD829_09335 [Chryseobacterium sp. HMWF035]